MFAKVEPSISIKEINEETAKFLESYYLLNDKLEEGLDIRFKFNNNWQGIPETLRITFDKIAKELLTDIKKFQQLLEEELWKIGDALVIASNHLDQQTSTEKNPKPSPKLKEVTVLNWLLAVKNIFPEYSKELLKNDPINIRMLSSMAQLYNFLGKALRYNPEIELKARLEVLMMAVEIARYLEENAAPEHDPHAYKGRLGTCLSPVIFTLRQLKRHKEALIFTDEQYQHASKHNDEYSKITPLTQKALIYKELFEDEAQEENIKEAIQYAKQAHELSQKFGNVITTFNALVTLMECHEAGQEKNEALDMRI